MTGLLLVAVLGGAVAADTSFAVGEATRLSIQSMRGDVEVRTWNEDRIEISSGVSIEDLNIRTSGRTIRVDPRHTSVHRSIDLRVTVPADLALDVQGTFSSVDIAGVTASVTVQTVHGGVRLVGGEGRVSLTSVQGGVTVENTRGDLRVHSTNGSVRVTRHEGGLSAEAVNGSITLEGITSSSVVATSLNGQITYRGSIGQGGDYEFRNHNGGVTLAIPGNTGATVSVSTFSGEFESDFPVTLREMSRGAREFQFTIGGGGARVVLESFAGRIRIRESSN